MRSNLPARVAFYVAWALQAAWRGRPAPLTSSLILTDECNLACRHCTVAHLGYARREFDDVLRDLRLLHDTGSRMLVLTGGEPFLWRDGSRGVEDVVDAARDLGFFRVVICTNGTLPLDSGADYLWVSLDGRSSGHAALRGGHHADVVANLRRSRHRGLFVNLTVTAVNLDDLDGAAGEILEHPGVRGIFFHLFTPYVGSDPGLRLDATCRRLALYALRRIKRRNPMRIVNTWDGIRELERNRWPRPTPASVVVNGGVLTPCCCRAGIYDERTCRECGCSPAVESHLLAKMRPAAALEFLRFL